jgi:hypothetical protein
MPRIELCDRCYESGIETKSIGNVAFLIKIAQKAKKYHKVGHLCSDCYLDFEDKITSIRGGKKE